MVKNEIHLRIDSIDTLEIANELVSSGKFRSANEIYNQAIKLGLPVLYKSIFGRKKSVSDDVDFLPEEQNKKLEAMLAEVSVNSYILEYLATTIYNVLLEHFDGSKVTKEYAEAGYYSQLPSSIQDIKNELMKNLKVTVDE